MFANPDPVGVVSVFQFDSDHYSAPDNVDNSGFSLSRHVLASSIKVNLNEYVKITCGLCKQQTRSGKWWICECCMGQDSVIAPIM
jgi:hypothetical protein